MDWGRGEPSQHFSVSSAVINAVANINQRSNIQVAVLQRENFAPKLLASIIVFLLTSRRNQEVSNVMSMHLT